MNAAVKNRASVGSTMPAMPFSRVILMRSTNTFWYASLASARQSVAIMVRNLSGRRAAR